jgi:hypothetical protein
MRRVVVTPTFAAGLGVVVAAILAYPMHTVFSYAAPGASCKVAGCSAASSGGGKAAGAGDRLKGTSPDSSDSGGGAGVPAGEPTPPSGRSGHAGAGGSPYVRYWAAHRGHGGFSGAIIIEFPHQVPAHWWLWFRYPSARLVKVWLGSSYLRHGPHSAIVSSKDLAGRAGDDRPVTIWVAVTGRSAPPPMCSLDGRPCHIPGQHRDGHRSHPGGRGSHHPGGRGSQPGGRGSHPGGRGSGPGGHRAGSGSGH